MRSMNTRNPKAMNAAKHGAGDQIVAGPRTALAPPARLGPKPDRQERRKATAKSRYPARPDEDPSA